MSSFPVSAEAIAKLVRLGEALIPASGSMPSFSDLPAHEDLLRTAIKACGYSDEAVKDALDAIPEVRDLEAAKAFSLDHPVQFEVVSVLISGAYFMSPDVLELLDYPVERRHPAEMEEFLEEYQTGIVNAVTERGPQFVDPAAVSKRLDDA